VCGNNLRSLFAGVGPVFIRHSSKDAFYVSRLYVAVSSGSHDALWSSLVQLSIELDPGEDQEVVVGRVVPRLQYPVVDS
jgi:hypothetical protein